MEPNTGGGDSRRIGHHCLGDFTLVTPGLPLHHLLRLQVMSGQEEKARPVHNLRISIYVHVPQMSGLYDTAHSDKALRSDLVSLPNFGSASVSRL